MELTSQNGFRHIRHLHTILDFSVPNWVFGTVFGIWSLWVSRYDIGSIGAIFGVQVAKFRLVFKGAVKLKGDIGLESDLRLGISVKIGWLIIWLVNKQT